MGVLAYSEKLRKMFLFTPFSYVIIMLQWMDEKFFFLTNFIKTDVCLIIFVMMRDHFDDNDDGIDKKKCNEASCVCDNSTQSSFET